MSDPVAPAEVDKKADNRPAHPDCERCKDLPADYYKRQYYERQRAKTAAIIAGTSFVSALVANFPLVLGLLRTLLRGCP